MSSVLDEESRAVGYTGAARQYPIEEALALVMFAAWNGVDPGQLPEAMRYFPNEATKRAWERVARAACEYLALQPHDEASR